MNAVSPVCSECEREGANYDTELEDYYCPKCRIRATHAERRPAPPLTPADDPWTGYTGGELPEALR